LQNPITLTTAERPEMSENSTETSSGGAIRDVIQQMLDVEAQAEEIVSKGEAAARHVLEEARDHAREVREKVKREALEEARHVIERARTEASRERDARLRQVAKQHEGAMAAARTRKATAVQIVLEPLTGMAAGPEDGPQARGPA